MTRFRDRRDAGRQLAGKLSHLRGAGTVVVGLPRGGVPVAFEVARELEAPLDVIIVRKLGVPFQPEVGMGAVGEGDAVVLNDTVVRAARVSNEELARVVVRERAEVAQRSHRFRGDTPPISLEGRTVVVVDDGLATGGTARAALQVARARHAQRIVLAVPVAPPETVEALRHEADEIVCLETPARMTAVGAWYDDFVQTSDDEVIQLLHAAKHGIAVPSATISGAGSAVDRPAPVRDEELTFGARGSRLAGHLTVPPEARGIVVFVHGSGSSRFSTRNRSVARALNDAGLGTLLFDLLTEDEALDRANVFDIPLLAGRLGAAVTWLGHEPEGQLPIGYFGASTGAGAALWAAAETDSPARAVVSRGGRPDLAAPRLALVRAPTLLIVGSRDEMVLELNREAAHLLRCEHRLEIVPGATHLFEESGALEAVGGLARDWFLSHLSNTKE